MTAGDLAGTGKNRDRPGPRSDAWDNAYGTQGRLWGGAPFPLPDLPDRSVVLELGCGSGKNAPLPAHTHHEWIGLDYSLHACRLARKATGGSTVADVVAADVRAIPLRSGSIDAVLASHVAGHLAERDRTLLVKESARVLRTGGLFIFSDFSARDFRAGTGTEIEPSTFLRGNGIATHYFTEDEVRAFSGRLFLHTIATRAWEMKVKGTIHPRAEVVALFVKA